MAAPTIDDLIETVPASMAPRLRREDERIVLSIVAGRHQLRIVLTSAQAAVLIGDGAALVLEASRSEASHFSKKPVKPLTRLGVNRR